MTPHPLVVDLDGTLIRTDMLHESALRVLRNKPFDTKRVAIFRDARNELPRFRDGRLEQDGPLLPGDLNPQLPRHHGHRLSRQYPAPPLEADFRA